MTQEAPPSEEEDISSGTEKVLVPLSHELAEEIREASGNTAVTDYIIEAVEEKRRNDLLATYLDDWEAKNGPVPSSAVDDFEKHMHEAERKYQAWLAHNGG